MNRSLHAAARAETWAANSAWLNALLSQADFAAVTRRTKLPSVTGNVAVLPMHGMITQRGSIWDDLFGGTSTDKFGAAFVRAINDDRVSAVVIDVDSGGGTVHGVAELGEVIAAGAQRKPVVAVANSMSASAAYWLPSQVGPGKFFATPGADVGSIGVYRMLEDVSEAMAELGIKTEFIAVPPEKVEDSGVVPLSQEARDHHLEQVGISYDAFTRAVAKGRSVSQSKVKSSFGKGRVFKAPQALEMGMIDRIATLGEVLGELTRGKPSMPEAASKVLCDDLCHAWETCECEPLSRTGGNDIRRKRLSLSARV